MVAASQFASSSATFQPQTATYNYLGNAEFHRGGMVLSLIGLGIAA